MIEALSKVIKRLHYPIELMLVCVHWYSAYPLSLRHIEEMMAERGVYPHLHQPPVGEADGPGPGRADG